MSANLKSLIGRMNDTCRNALEGAAGLCLSRTNYDVDVEHLLVKLGETPDTDFHRILRRFEIDESRLAKDLVRSLDRLKTGNTRTPALSPASRSSSRKPGSSARSTSAPPGSAPRTSSSLSSRRTNSPASRARSPRSSRRSPSRRSGRSSTRSSRARSKTGTRRSSAKRRPATRRAARRAFPAGRRRSTSTPST